MADSVQVAKWVVAAGFTGSAAVIATAIGLASSGGNPQAAGGLFGLGNSGDGPAQAAQAFSVYNAAKTAAGPNADAGEPWRKFPAFTDGRYALYVPTAELAVRKAGAPTDPTKSVAKDLPIVGDFVAGVGDTFSNIGDLVSGTFDLVTFLRSPDAWQRIIKISLGGVLILGSVLYVVKRTVFDQAVKAAGLASAFAGPAAAFKYLKNSGREASSTPSTSSAPSAPSRAPRTRRTRVPNAPAHQPRHAAPEADTAAPARPSGGSHRSTERAEPRKSTPRHAASKPPASRPRSSEKLGVGTPGRLPLLRPVGKGSSRLNRGKLPGAGETPKKRRAA